MFERGCERLYEQKDGCYSCVEIVKRLESPLDVSKFTEPHKSCIFFMYLIDCVPQIARVFSSLTIPI